MGRHRVEGVHLLDELPRVLAVHLRGVVRVEGGADLVADGLAALVVGREQGRGDAVARVYLPHVDDALELLLAGHELVVARSGDGRRLLASVPPARELEECLVVAGLERETQFLADEGSLAASGLSRPHPDRMSARSASLSILGRSLPRFAARRISPAAHFTVK